MLNTTKDQHHRHSKEYKRSKKINLPPRSVNPTPNPIGDSQYKSLGRIVPEVRRKQ